MDRTPFSVTSIRLHVMGSKSITREDYGQHPEAESEGGTVIDGVSVVRFTVLSVLS